MLPYEEDLRKFSTAELAELRTSSGRPFGQVDVRLVDEMGQDVLWGALGGSTAGECVTRGETVFSGYYKQPEATSSTFQHGWFKTGDLATPVGCALVVPAESALQILCWALAMMSALAAGLHVLGVTFAW